MRNETMTSIDVLMDELRQVVEVAEDDEVEMFSYILAELKTVFRRKTDVQMLQLWSDVRLP